MPVLNRWASDRTTPIPTSRRRRLRVRRRQTGSSRQTGNDGGRCNEPDDPAVRPARSIDDDLAALWRDLARDAPLPARGAVEPRRVLSSARRDASVEVVRRYSTCRRGEVAGRHSVADDRPQSRSSAPATPCAAFAASVGVLTFGADSSRYGVEEIVIRSVCGEASLPSIVRRLAFGGLPTSVWWTPGFLGGEAARSAGHDGASARCTTVGNGATFGRACSPSRSRCWRACKTPDLADLNWRRLTTFRQALVQAIDSAPAIDPQRFAQVRSSSPRRRGGSRVASGGMAPRRSFRRLRRDVSRWTRRSTRLTC